MKRLQWIIDREIDEKSNPSNQIGQFKFFKTKDLHNHYGCVNALCVSQEGYLVTSGDDLRVLLYKPSVFYDLDEDGDGENSPHLKSSFTGHVSNVFCVAANPATTKLYSCGNDGFLIFYDVVTGRSETRLAHEDACMRLSLHPTNEHVLLSASQDFSIRLWDSRSSSEEGILIPRRLSTGILLSRNRSMQNYVEFNPTNPNEFVTSDATSGIFLWDIRNAFSCSTTLRNQIHSLVPPLVTFTTRQVKKNPRKDSIMISKLIDISSAVFSKDGKYICANIQKSCPVLYDKDLVDPIAVFDDPGWSSLATIKIGCFSDSIPGASAHYFGGSDNGTTYGFEIPPEFELLENQEKSKFQSTLPLSFSPTFLNKDSREYIIPFSVSSQYELKSGNSIINSCVSHPTDSIIVSAGIEKSVHLFSSIKELPITEKKKVNQDPRTQESRVTLNLFSRLIQQERASLERSNAADWNQLVEIDNALQELIEDDMIGDDTIEDDTDSLQDHSSTSMSS